jgi:CubicO group peptidase (beta-lactamase class C family)
MRSLLYVLLLVSLCFQCNPTILKHKNQKSTEFQKIEKQIIEFANQNSWKGVMISYRERSGISFAEGYGVKNGLLESVDQYTKFQTGSITKIITALLIIKLQEQKKLSLDKPISTYLKDWNFKTDPSIREILTHHSGLPSDLYNGFQVNEFPVKMKIPPFQETEFKNKNTFSYSNLGYSILGVLIEKLSNQSVEEFAKKELFQPLAMGDSGFTPPSGNYSDGYVSHWVNPLIIRDLTAGSFYTTANDFQSIMEILLQNGKFRGKNIFSESSIQELFRIQNLNSIEDGTFSIGIPFWLENTNLNYPIFVHGGDLPPFHGFLALDLKQGKSIIVVTNTMSSSIIIHDLVLKILDLEKPSINHDFRVSTSHDLSGIYFGPNQFIELNSYYEEFSTNMGPIYLKYHSETQLYPHLRLFRLFPIRVPPLELLSFEILPKSPNLVLKAGSLPLVVFRKSNPKDLNTVWKKRIGKYKIINQVGSTELIKPELNECESGICLNAQLKLTHMELPLTIYLRIENDSTAVSEGGGRNAGELLKVIPNGNSEILEYSGYRMVK